MLGATRPCTSCLLSWMRSVQAAPASAPWPYSSWIKGGRQLSQPLPQPQGDLDSDLCSPSSPYSLDSQARTCRLSPSKMASVIRWGNPAGCPVVICA